MSNKRLFWNLLVASLLVVACSDDDAQTPSQGEEQKPPVDEEPGTPTTPSAVCGNGVREAEELCDGQDGVPNACSEYDENTYWVSGTPACSPDCKSLNQGSCVAGELHLDAYPAYPEDKMPRDYDYTVKVTQGNKTIELPVYNPVLQSGASSIGLTGDSHRRYSEFAFSGEPVTIEVTVNMDFDSYSILPSSKQIASTLKDQVITYQLDKPQTTLIRVNDDYDSILTIFAEEPENLAERPDPSDPSVIYFAAGYHEVEGGVLKAENGKTVYLEPGALVKARVYLKNDVKVFGRGAFMEPSLTRMPIGNRRYACTISGQNILIKDVRFLDTRDFMLVVSNTNDLEIDHVKCLANQISTDGFSIWGNTNRAYIHDSFWHVNDNIFVISGTNSDIKIERNIIGSDHAMFFPQKDVVGDPIIIRDIDVFRAGSILKSTYNPEKVDRKVDDFHLENIFAEDAVNGSKFIWMSGMGKSPKNYSMTNVSAPTPQNQYLPNNSTKYQILIDKGMGDISFKFDNVWVNGKPFLKKDDLAIYCPEPSNQLIFTERSDAKAAFAGMRNIQTLDTPWIAPKVKIGELLVESRVSPFIENDTVYVSLLEIIQQFAFSNITWDEQTLAFKDLTGKEHALSASDPHYILRNHRLMVPTSFFEQNLGVKCEYQEDTKTVAVQNIPRQGNLLKNPGMEDGLSLEWITHNFSQLYQSKEAHSGKLSIQIVNDSTPENGIKQAVHSLLRQYGAGTYRFSAWVKQNNPDVSEQTFAIGLSSAYNFSSSKLLNTEKVGQGWKKIEYEYDLENPEKLRFVLLTIAAIDGKGANFLVDDVTMEKIK